MAVVWLIDLFGDYQSTNSKPLPPLSAQIVNPIFPQQPRRTLKFVLDTGTPVNLVNAQHLAVASIACRKPASGKPDCDPRSLGNVRDSDGHSLGELKAERVKLGGAPFDGLLGAPFFHEHRVLFDLPGHRLLISPPD